MLFVVTILLTYSSQAFVLPFPRHAFVAPSSALYEASKQAADQDLSELVNEVLDEAAEAVLNDEIDETELAPGEVSDSIELFTRDQESEEQTIFDNEQMRLAIQLAQSGGGERGVSSPFPKPLQGAVLVHADGTLLGKGRSDHRDEAVVHCLKNAGVQATPLSEWVVTWNPTLRDRLKNATLYLTLEPSPERRGQACPPLTQLIAQAGVTRVVIGTTHPVTPTQGAYAMHQAGLEVVLLQNDEDCHQLVEPYAELTKTKMQRIARIHFQRTGRPLGFLHCSVVDSDNVEAFARQGNAFGKDFGGKNLGYRDFGSYGIAPPPDVVWARDVPEEDFETEITNVDFEDEEEVERVARNPMMPWYEQVDAVVVTFPKAGNGPSDDDSVTARLSGLKWLALQGESLPAAVERILVLDATDLADLPLTNDDPNLPPGMDVEAFWKGHQYRKPVRVLLRKGENAQAQAAARAAAAAAQAAAEAAKAAMEALETGDAAEAAQAALTSQEAAAASFTLVQTELAKAQELKRRLTECGVVVETINGGEPVDVMKHLGQRHGYQSVVWRAGCWGERGVRSILADSFQYVSAHLAVDAVGGRFWQLMLAERAVQAACGPERKVKVFSDDADISLEYCDEAEADSDCVLTVDGRPIRHVRLDCRIALVDESRGREFRPLQTTVMTRSKLIEEAPWFL